MTDYVLIEGNLDEILEYNITNAEWREGGFHDEIACIKEDHRYETCRLCRTTGMQTAQYFKMLANDGDWAVYDMGKPIYVEAVDKYI